MPTVRSGIAAAVVNNQLWVFGGEDPGSFTINAEVEVYNPVTNTWRQLPDMPSPRHGIWASVIGNKVYMPGGGSAAGFAATDTNQDISLLLILVRRLWVTSALAAFFRPVKM